MHKQQKTLKDVEADMTKMNTYNVHRKTCTSSHHILLTGFNN